MTSRYALESVNSSMRLSFRVPVPSETMCMMYIDSLVVFTPSAFLISFVAYKRVGVKRTGADTNELEYERGG